VRCEHELCSAAACVVPPVVHLQDDTGASTICAATVLAPSARFDDVDGQA
jgi:hypothetical protein